MSSWSFPIAALRRGAVALACMAACGAAAAQTYPTKPIRLLVPFAPGGAVDIIGRLMAQSINESLGQAVVVENRPGAGGLLAMEEAAKAAPDGYTLAVGAAGPLTVSPSLFKERGFDPLAKLEPVIWYASTPGILVVNPALKANTVSELVALSKSGSRPLAMGSAGSGSINHLMGEYFQQATGVTWMHVPYKGSAPALTDLVGGNVQVMMDIVPTATPLVKAGKLRALAVTTPKRSNMLPSVPTVAELGYPGFDASSWISLNAPHGTPASIIQTLNRALNDGLAKEDVRRRITDIGAEPEGGTPQKVADRLRLDLPRWAKLLEQAGVTVQ
ncbi:Tripartite tricarboxylate transporter family receptor [Pigmentiphaga humi]|uniref:Tripartite tricarboxylate transporter family receptor n=1 Tax=Pigmentiphaga humi TaxID=2478468 RepID=A0A3P4B694_9BURK|nr:tripartite tricarboxylate transporter substrate binding protein [Pigmentiphaga humi]VCU71807.1 Tripartite tricarboxylate transporter family receptor [Pigmentiphaga humi]